MKLGKKPAVYSRKTLRLSDYLTTLPPVPADNFGHETLVTQPWGVLGNDALGDCAIAGPGHETMLWNAEAGQQVAFSDANTIADYSAITGYNPADPATDQGSIVLDVLNYRRNTGLLDAAGARHKIGAFVSLEVGNLDHLYAALYLFGALGIGINFPGSAMDQFNDGQPWEVVPGASIDGGHYVPLVAKRGNLLCVTWGRLQAVTETFLTTYMDEAYAMLSPEMLADGKSPGGFDLPALQADLQAL